MQYDDLSAEHEKLLAIFEQDNERIAGLVERLHFVDVRTATVEGSVVVVQDPAFKFQTDGSWPYVNTGLLFYDLGDEFRVMMHVWFPSLS